MLSMLLPEFSNGIEWKTKQTNTQKIQAVFQSDEEMVIMKPKPHIILSKRVSYLIMIHN